ncbi:MAG TPA: uracil-DNA glycosylase [Candidatus Acidoferrales bacterium]|nr:uracil-DNA glycosylase [Candidatus Acidoferrales bacterium]
MEWREKIAIEKTARFHNETYWGKPVPGFGDPMAKVLIVGLAPAAHGANRTGRMFTGDRSGEWLYSMLHKFEFSSERVSSSADDNLRLKNCYITAVVRCAPPANKPAKDEIHNCQPYLSSELQILEGVEVIVTLGKIAFDWTIDSLSQLHFFGGRTWKENFERRPKFAHGVKLQIDEKLTLIASYHPSQQNTFTGKLTKRMFESVFKDVKELLG